MWIDTRPIRPPRTSCRPSNFFFAALEAGGLGGVVPATVIAVVASRRGIFNSGEFDSPIPMMVTMLCALYVGGNQQVTAALLLSTPHASSCIHRLKFSFLGLSHEIDIETSLRIRTGAICAISPQPVTTAIRSTRGDTF